MPVATIVVSTRRLARMRFLLAVESTASGQRGSIDLDVGGLHDRRPFLRLGGEKSQKGLRRAGPHLCAQLGEGCRHLLRRQALVDRSVERLTIPAGVPAGATTPI